jgi:Uma2 family endonuclease
MAQPEPLPERVTVEEWRQILQRSNLKFEYHDGCLVAMSGGTVDQADIGFNTVAALRRALRGSNCHAHGSDAAVRFQPTEYRFCDAVVSCNPQDRGTAQEVQTPRVVVEVLSPSTEREDRTAKYTLARSCPSVETYVLIWTRYQCVEVYDRAEPSWTQRIYWPGQEAELPSLGVRLPLADLYAETSVPLDPQDAGR